MLKIGDFSKLSQISIRMLRYYDELDILKPSNLDENTGYRFYSAEQLETASTLQKLKSLGFSNKEVKKILEDRSVENVKSHFDERARLLLEELKSLQKASIEMQELVQDDFDKLEYHALLKKIPKRKVIRFRKKVPSYMDEYLLWDELYTYMKKENISPLKDGYQMAIYHDTEYKEENVDIEVQVSVTELKKGKGPISFDETEEWEVVSVLFHGSYEKMPLVTKSAMLWIERNGYNLVQPTFNIFHVSPAQDKNPNHWITEACFKIEKRNDENGKTNY